MYQNYVINMKFERMDTDFTSVLQHDSVVFFVNFPVDF